MINQSTFRKHRTSFLEGFTSMLDTVSTSSRYKIYDTPNKANRVALASDWKKIGDDMRHVLSKQNDE